MVLDGTGGDFFHRRLTDSSPGKTDNTKQSFVITTVDSQTKVSEGIFNLLTLVERRTAIDAVGNIQFTQFPFDDTTLCVRAVQNGERVIPFELHSLDLRRYTQCLRAVIHVGLQIKRLAFFFLRIDGFLNLVYVLMNQRVSSINDILGGAVVLLQFEQLRLRINALEIKDITDVRSAEGIDTLRIIPHDADVVLRFSQLLDEQELDIVRILVLIHKDILELLLVFLLHFRTDLHESQHINQQVIKVHGVRRFETRFIELVDGRKLIHTQLPIFTQQVRILGIRTRTDTAVLRHGDTGLYRTGFVDLLIQTPLFANRFDNRFTVRRIVYREVAGIAEQVGIRTNEPRADGVERTHREIARLSPHQFGDTLLHLSCRFVRKRKRHDTGCRHTLLQQVCDTISQYTRLTRTGSGHNERRPFGIGHRLALRVI